MPVMELHRSRYDCARMGHLLGYDGAYHQQGAAMDFLYGFCDFFSCPDSIRHAFYPLRLAETLLSMQPEVDRESGCAFHGSC